MICPMPRPNCRSTLLLSAVLLTFAASAASVASAAPKAIPDPETVIAKLRAEYAPDSRTALFEAKADILPDGTVRIQGLSDMPEALAQLRAAYYAKGIPTDASLTVVPNRDHLGDKLWGMIKTPDAPVFDHPEAAPADRIPAGTPVRRYETRDGLTRMQLPDGTIVWTFDEFVRTMNDTALIIWNRADKIVITAPRVPFAEESGKTDVALVTLGAGTHLRIYEKRPDGWIAVLPDGTKGFVAKTDAEPLEVFQEREENARRASQADFMKATAETALQLRKSGTFTDADRLVRTAFRMHDLLIQRDADMMQKAFPAVDPGKNYAALQPGDLLFFKIGEGKLEATLSLGKSRFVALPDMTGDTADFLKGKKSDRTALKKRFVGAARVDPGFLTDPCLTATRSNPFYQAPPKGLTPCRKRADVPMVR